MKRGFALGASIAWVLSAINLQWKMWPQRFGCDFRIYYHAALGDLTWKGEDGLLQGWLYNDAFRYLWVPFTWLPEFQALAVWMVLMFTAYVTLIVKVSKHEHGWLVILATAIPFGLAIVAGNVSPLLALLLTTAGGSYFSVAIKPHTAPLALFRAVAESRARRGVDEDAGLRHADLPVPSRSLVASLANLVRRRPVGGCVDALLRLSGLPSNDRMKP
jgi:hypothetical protein